MSELRRRAGAGRPFVLGMAIALALVPFVSTAAEPTTAELSFKLDALWVLIAAVLVFSMQTGFLLFEAGCVRSKNALVTALKNVGDWLAVVLAFFVVGFALMFGRSGGGWIGTSGFGGNLIHEGAQPLGWIFVLFQVAFAGTAATIVSGAMAERTTFKAYVLFSLYMGAVIYPVYGHWVWGNGYISSNKPWLASLGYIDFAGSSVVHVVGGVASLIGVWFVGPRMGLFASDGTRLPMPANNLAWSAAGVLLLWFGWWGFNGGSTLALNQDVGSIIFNTNIAGAAAGIAAVAHCVALQRSQGLTEKMLGGALTGLVAITANCHIVSAWSSVAIGVIAGVIHNLAYDFMQKRVDDVVGAVPVHAAGGVWGVLAVAIFGRAEALPHPFLEQLGVQALGVVACIAWVGLNSVLCFYLLKTLVGIRVTPAQEIHGISFEEEELPSAGAIQ